MGTYRDTEKLIAEIGRLKLQYLTDKQIIEALQIPRRTYYYYLKQWRQQISELIKERDKSHLEAEIERAKEGIELDIQELSKLAKEAESDADKIAAIKERKQARIDIIKLEYEGPEILAEREQNDKGQTTSKEAKPATESANQ